MSYKILHITTYYTLFLQNFYINNNHLIEKSYDKNLECLIQARFGYSDFYIKHLNSFGNKAELIIANDQILQNKWAYENETFYKSKCEDDKNIVFSQIKKFKPEVIFIEDYNYFNKDEFDFIRYNNPSLKKIILHCCAPYDVNNHSSFSKSDLIITCTPGFRDNFIDLGFRSYLLYNAFELSILKEIENFNNNNSNNFIFIGSLFMGNSLHDERINYLERFIKLKIPITIYGQSSISRTMFKTKIRNLLNLNFEFIKMNKFLEKLKDPVFGIDMFKLLKQSLLTFNIHGGIAGQCAGNMRLFEATGTGVCLITDNKKNLSTLFDIDNEIVVYESLQECTDKITWLLNNPNKAKEIGLNGQKRVIKSHSFESRVEEFNQVILKLLK